MALSSPALFRGRALAESLMTDTCTVTRTTRGALNEGTGTYDADTSTEVYAGRCRVRSGRVMGVEQDAGERMLVANRTTVSLPADTTGVDLGDVVTVTASPYSPSLVGAAFRVRSIDDNSQPTALRLECEEV